MGPQLRSLISTMNQRLNVDIDGLVQDCGISSALYSSLALSHRYNLLCRLGRVYMEVVELIELYLISNPKKHLFK